MKKEAEAVAKFLIGLEMPTRRSQLIVEGGDGKKKAVNCEYVVGTKLHFTIMTNAEKILKLVPTMESHKSFNGLKSI